MKSAKKGAGPIKWSAEIIKLSVGIIQWSAGTIKWSVGIIKWVKDKKKPRYDPASDQEVLKVGFA